MDWNGILQAMRVPGMERVFVLGSFERRVTIYSQQVRAMNLIEGLCRTEKITAGTPVAIVGAGVAGLTAAAAAAHRGADVTVIERAEAPFPLFRRAPSRWLHPFIYDWPRRGCDTDRAGLPLLDWEAGTVEQVVAQLDLGWREHAAKVKERYSAGDIKLFPDDRGVRATWNVAPSGCGVVPDDERFDVVVLAIGFGVEDSIISGQPSYWSPDDLDEYKWFDREPGQRRRLWLVSGCGDGALTDVLRLCLLDFQHERMVGDFVSDPSILKAIEKITQIESDPKAQDSTNPEYLSAAYKSLKVPFVIDKLKARLRLDTAVTLNAPSPDYFTTGSSVLNRFLLAQLRHAGAFRFLPGTVLPSTAKDGNEVRVDFEDGTVERFDRVVLRHGPKSAIKKYFPTIWTATASLRETWRDAPLLLDRTRDRLWDIGTFGPEVRPDPNVPATGSPVDMVVSANEHQVLANRLVEHAARASVEGIERPRAAVTHERAARVEAASVGGSVLDAKLLGTKNEVPFRTWFNRQSATAINDLDTRYTPTFHVLTDSEKLLDAVAGANSFAERYAPLLRALTAAAKNLSRLSIDTMPAASHESTKRFINEIASRLPTLGQGEAKTPLMQLVREVCDAWQRTAQDVLRALAQVPNAGLKFEGASSPSPLQERPSFSHERELVQRFLGKVEALDEFGISYSCADAQFILVRGAAGSGKSHLLANLVQSSQTRGQPALLLLGEYFLSTDEPWRQLSDRLGWESSVRDLLSGLQSAAEAAGSPALICIDALNESPERTLWRTHLSAFAARIADYPSVRLVVSCREDFAHLTLPPQLAERRDPSWAFIGHQGFGGSIFEAVASYFSGYGVKSPHFPPLLPEFRNPLFLKMFCEAFANSQLPDGPITFSAVMEVRIDKICKRLLRDIDCPPSTTRRAIAVIAELIKSARGQSVLVADLRPEVDALLAGRGESRSLYRHLCSNGLLVEVASPADNNYAAVRVRFPFERFADYFVADLMLQPYHSFEALQRGWTEDGTLVQFGERANLGLYLGPTSALAILVPERFGREFISLFLDDGRDHIWLSEFLASLAWRSATSFNEESQRVLQRAQSARFNEYLSAILAVATIPRHPYNALFLHARLKAMPLSERELSWTIPLNRVPTIENLLRWTFRVPLALVSDEQAALAGLILAWLCSSNHRDLRLRATLAAIHLLANRAHIAARLVRELHDVDDPYVVERVFAIAAGVAMRDSSNERLHDLATAVSTTFFGREETPPNVLVRDFASCVLEIAYRRGALPLGVTPERFRPPFRSTWPHIWSEEEAQATTKEDGWYAIAASVKPECTGFYGDFGRYTMEVEVRHFSEVPLVESRQPEHDTPMFDSMTARRWILQRVAELGWTPERFKNHDQSLPHGRQSDAIERRRAERIGKKYQWIALRELLGYLSDHYRMLPEWGSQALRFVGTWQLCARDFDPSQPLRDPGDIEPEENSPQHAAPWWLERYPNPFADSLLCADPSAWVRKSPVDFALLIEQPRTPRTQGEYLMLGGHCSWHEDTPLGSLRPRPGRLSRWIDIRTWLVPQRHFLATLATVRKIQFWGVGVDTETLGNQWLGQYPWGSEFADLRERCGQADRWVRDETMPIAQTIVSYGDGLVPAPQLVELLQAHWSGNDLDFMDTSGKLVAFSPFDGRGSSLAPLLVRKAALVTALRAAGLEIMWAVVGDQNCFDHERGVHVADEEMKFSAVYWLDGDILAGGPTIFDVQRIRGR